MRGRVYARCSVIVRYDELDAICEAAEARRVSTRIALIVTVCDKTIISTLQALGDVDVTRLESEVNGFEAGRRPCRKVDVRTIDEQIHDEKPGISLFRISQAASDVQWLHAIVHAVPVVPARAVVFDASHGAVGAQHPAENSLLHPRSARVTMHTMVNQPPVVAQPIAPDRKHRVQLARGRGLQHG